MKRFRYITYAVLGAATLLALLPIGWLVNGWADGAPAPMRSTDWVRWTERGGTLVADYVHPGGPAAQAGLQEGDELYMFSYRPYRQRAALRQAVASVPPGEVRAYHVLRDGRFERLNVTLTPPSPFLYPLSPGVWTFAIWAFAFGAFFHLLGFLVAGPLARGSRRARFALLPLVASSLWVFGTLLRLLIIETAGLPAFGTTLRDLFDGLGLVSALGWAAFPALLLHKTARDTQSAAGQSLGGLALPVYLPVFALALVAYGAAPGAFSFQPGLLHVLVTPMLLYTCCYVAASAALVLAYLHLAPTSMPPGSWGDTGSASLLVSATLAAGLVLVAVPFFEPVTEATTGWLIVAVQLLSTVPGVLATLAALRYSQLSTLLTRALTYVAFLGAIFFAYVGGYTVIDAYLRHEGAARHVVAGLFVVLLLLVFERLARRLRLYVSRFFATGPQRARETLSRFQEQMRTILTHEALAQQTAAAVGDAFGARSVRLFLRAADPDAAAGPASEDRTAGPASGDDAPHGWITGAYHPEPPYLTERHFERIWPSMRREGRVWARNPELRDSTLPERRAQIFEERGVALAIPIAGEGEPIGLLVLSGKEKRGAMYNRADLDLLRFLSGQLALATERLDLVARERALVRASAQAELAALRAQINPHFLFNALNTIASLIAIQPKEAEATVEHLASIFRHILQTGSQSFVTLEEEFTLVRHYLHIEQVRFGGALEAQVELPPALKRYPVPAFAVQTLVENAVKHGIAKKRGGGRVHISARHTRFFNGERAVEIVVDDTGAGIPALFPSEAEASAKDGAEDSTPRNGTPRNGASHHAPAGGERPPAPGRKEHAEDRTSAPRTTHLNGRAHPPFYGIGLRNVADRLERLYARTDLLRLSSAPDQGTTARLYLPPAPDEADNAASSSMPPEALRRV